MKFWLLIAMLFVPSVCRAQLFNPSMSVALSQILNPTDITGHSMVWEVPSGVPRWTADVQGGPCTITAATSVTCTHNLKSLAVRVWIWDSSGYLVRPARVQRPTINTVQVTFDSAFTGIAVIK